MKQFILMCDIIGSGDKEQKLLMHQFKKCTEYINNKHQENIVSPLTITLGDEFQGLIDTLENTLTIIVNLEEFIIEQNFQFKLRYVLVYGEIETEINTNIAFEMLGKGLTQARKLITHLKNDHHRFYVDVGHPSLNTILNQLFALYENTVDEWKIDKDHNLISSFIKNRDYKIVAAELNKNRSLIWKREKTLNISSYFSIKNILLTIPDFIKNDHRL